MKRILLTAVAFTALGVVGCTQASNRADDMPKKSQTSDKKPSQRDIGNRVEVVTALQANDRTEADKKNDGIRKSEFVLQFADVWPGMTVVELEAGSGYYTDLLSRIVGKDGKVIMQNPAAFDQFLKPEVMEVRLKPLANVRLTKSNFDSLNAPDNSADIVTWFLGPHELFYTPEGGQSLGDVDKAYSEIFRVLKPGGHFIVLDHAASKGAPETTGGDLHRIDPALVTTRAKKAGLVLSDTSPILHNRTDDHTKNVFDPAIRRKTDRFLHKYTKPKH